MEVNTKVRNDTTFQSPTQIQNQGFDQTYQLPVVENLVFNPVTSEIERMKPVATESNQTDGSQRTQIDALPTIYNGSKTVTTGTAEAIATTQVIHSVTVKALSTNTVAVYVGASGVTTFTGIELLAGESISLDVTNLATVFVISGSASQVVRYIGL